MVDSREGKGSISVSQSVRRVSNRFLALLPFPFSLSLSLSVDTAKSIFPRSSKGENEEERIRSVEGIREDSLRVIQFYYFSVSAGE